MNKISYILQYVTEITIYSYYLKLDPSVIIYCIENNAKINNPLRHDENPSFSFRYIQTEHSVKLKTKDFANDRYSGDFIDIVGIVLGKNPNKKHDFIYILNHIIENVVHANIIDNYQLKPIIRNSYFNIDFELRKWLPQDYNYWLQFQVPLTYINQYVFPVYNAKGVYENGNEYYIYTYNEQDPCYVYKQTVIKEKRITKLYFPLRLKKDERGRFHTNNINILPFDAITHLRYSDNLIIIKSYKDYILLQYLLQELNINDIDVIPISSENDVITDKYANYFNEKYNNIYTFLDFDKQGITISNLYRKKYKFKPIFLTNGRFNTINYEAKDIAELLSKKAIEAVLDLIQFIYIQNTNGKERIIQTI